MKANLRITIMTAIVGLAGETCAQSSSTNDVILPVIEVHDAPLPKAIDTVARLADFNYLLDPTLFPTVDAGGHVVEERKVSFRMENVSAKAVLVRVLELQHLVLEKAPGSRIAIITRAGSALTKYPPIVNTSTNDELLPLVEFGDIPITSAIENLARQAGLNYLIDPTVFPTGAEGKPAREPSINLRSRNVSAKDVLMRMLFAYGYALMEDPASNIAFVTHAGQSTNRLFTGMTEVAIQYRGVYTNLVYTNDPIPLIQFSDVPITTAIENLARAVGVNYMLDYKLGRRWSGSGRSPMAEPLLNIRLEEVTAWNTLNRMLNLHNLVMVDNPITHIWQIRAADEPAYHLDASLLGLDTNNVTVNTKGDIPLIEFSSVPLYEALEALIRQDSLPVVLDPRFKKSRDPLNQITLSLRWEGITAKQAIIALCQNYDLVIVEAAPAERLRIEPKPGWK